MGPGSGARLSAAALSAFIIGVSTFVSAGAVGAPMGTSSTPTPVACRNLPVSSQAVHPASCLITGPTSFVITGTAADNAADGVAITVDLQTTKRAVAKGRGRLTVRTVGNGHACLDSAGGASLGLDLVSMQTTDGCTGPPPRPSPQGGGSDGGGSAMASQEVMAHMAAGSPPAPASSYYVYGSFVSQCGSTATTGCQLYVDGADEPAPSGGALVVLDFGAPCYATGTSGNVYGTQLFGTSSCTTDDALLPLAQAFLRGYQSTHGAGTPAAIIGLGTSNSVNGIPGQVLGAPEMSSSGQAWFQNLVQPFAAAATGAAPVVTWAASDIEQSSNTSTWYGPNESLAWVRSYSTTASASLGAKRCSGNDPYRMADYGDDVVGAGGWAQVNIYEAAWGAQASCAVPEIYVTANGSEWQTTSQWGVANGKGPIAFTGPMSLNGEAGYMSDVSSWNNLAAATGQSTPYLTDIGAAYAGTPGPPTNVNALAGDQSATAWWSPPASDGGAQVQDYVVTAYAGSTAASSVTVRGLPPPTSATIPGLTNGTTYTVVVTATNATGAGAPSTNSNGVVPGPGRYHPLTPARILDTRNGVGAPTAPLGPQGQLTLQITGTGQIPSSGVAAVVLNVTVTDTTAASYLTVFPAQLPRPTASNLNWTAGTTVPNLVEVPVGPSGGVSFFNAAGNTNVVADVEGYVDTADQPAQPDGRFVPVSPTRVLDTRSGTTTNPTLTTALGPKQTMHVNVAQSGQEAVALNITVTKPTAASYLTVWPDGATQPTVSNLNFTPGQTIANRVMVMVANGGKVSIYNAAGTVQVIADLNGSFTDPTTLVSGARFQGLQPTRILDTRNGIGGIRGAIGSNGSLAVQVGGVDGVPSTASAVVANLTVTDTTAASYLTAWPDGATRPNASDLNWTAGRTVPNLAVVELGPDGKVDLYNAAGSTDVVLDVVGFYR